MKQQGFTMTELVVVVAIIGLIAGVAYPSYLSQMEKSRRAEAKIALTSLTQVQESFYSDNNRYTTALNVGGLNCVQRGLCLLDGSTIYTPEKYYQLSITPETSTSIARSYKLIATVNPTGRQKNDTKCHVFSLNHKNIRTATNTSGNNTSEDCW